MKIIKEAQYPADITKDLPRDLEAEIDKLVAWLKDSVNQAASVTGPSSQARSLPWFKHGTRGFFRKLWYGEHPDNPSYADCTQPMIVGAIQLNEYKKLEEILDSQITRSVLCESSNPALDQIFNQFSQKLKNIILQYVIRNGVIRPASPKDNTISGNLEKFKKEKISQDRNPAFPELNAKTNREKKAKEEIEGDAETAEEVWKNLNYEIVHHELPTLKIIMGPDKPNNFSEFQDILESAINNKIYQASPVMSMCMEKRDLLYHVYQLLNENWAALASEEKDWIEEEIKRNAREIINLTHTENEDLLFDTLAAMILTQPEKVKSLSPKLVLIVKSMQNRKPTDQEKREFANIVISEFNKE